MPLLAAQLVRVYIFSSRRANSRSEIPHTNNIRNFWNAVIRSGAYRTAEITAGDRGLIENSYGCLASSRPITRISNGSHSSLTRRHRHVLNNLSPRSYRKVPSASWYDGSIVLEEERGLRRGRRTERYEIMRCTRVLS